MAEYSREQRKQESRAIASETGNKQLKGFVDNNILSKLYSFDSAETSLGKQQNIEKALIQRTIIPTPHGDFEDKENKLTTNGKELNFELEFNPKKETNATKIGLVQAVKRSVGGTAIAIDPNAAMKMSDAGYRIDQHSEYPNPLYATTKNLVSGTTDKTELANYETNTYWGQHAIKNDDDWTQPAKLKDAPTTNKGKANAEKVFETTALAIEGTEKGTYYGSITWGCNTDASGVVTKHDIAKASDGNPSDNFMGAAEKWNAGKTRGTLKTKNKIDIEEVKSLTDWAGTGSRLSLEENCSLKQECTINDGGIPSLIVTVLDIDKIGCIAVDDVEDMKDGKDTVKLPIPS